MANNPFPRLHAFFFTPEEDKAYEEREARRRAMVLLPQDQMEEEEALALLQKLEASEDVEYADWNPYGFYKALLRDYRYCDECKTEETHRLSYFRVAPAHEPVIKYYCYPCAQAAV